MLTGGSLEMADDVVYIDFDSGVKRLMNNTKLYIRLITKFRDETKLDELEAVLAAGDMVKAQGEAHTIKGVAANLSLSELFKQSLELETQIKANAVNPAQVETVKAVFAATLLEVNKVIAEHA
jgi:HPt (histidine-containing phosphotransfer) domain-containing protein